MSKIETLNLGLTYLATVQHLSLNPKMVDLLEKEDYQVSVCNWITSHIATVNHILDRHLNACHNCFFRWERRSIQVLAAPLAQSFGIDGLCNLQTKPITILIDVGRVHPDDWLGLVVHEYSHAHIGFPGHDHRFISVLSHLCLGLGLEPPERQETTEHLRHWPYATPITDPLALWLGYSGWESLWTEQSTTENQ